MNIIGSKNIHLIIIICWSVRTYRISNASQNYKRAILHKTFNPCGICNGHSKRTFPDRLARIVSSGLLDRMYKLWWGTDVSCKNSSPFEELGFSHTVSAFLVLVIGVVVGLAALAAEIVVARWSVTRAKSTNKVAY